MSEALAADERKCLLFVWLYEEDFKELLIHFIDIKYLY